MEKISDLIDIKAPCEEVFNTIINIEKRMQLSPLWGVSHLLEVTPNYPLPGSSYRIKVLSGAPFGISQGTLNPSQSALAGLSEVLYLKLAASGDQNPGDLPAVLETPIEQPQPIKSLSEQAYFIDEYQPPDLFSYHLDLDCKTLVTWRCQSIHSGTRVLYEEMFCDERMVGDNFIPTLHGVVHEWLTNIKQYNELRGGRLLLLTKWFLDRFYLKLRPDQRRVVLIMLVLQAVGIATFILAIIGWTIARILF